MRFAQLQAEFTSNARRELHYYYRQNESRLTRNTGTGNFLDNVEKDARWMKASIRGGRRTGAIRPAMVVIPVIIHPLAYSKLEQPLFYLTGMPAMKRTTARHEISFRGHS